MFLLDTDICIYIMKGMFPPLRDRMQRHPLSLIAIPAMTKAELYFGAFKSNSVDKTLKKVDDFLAPFSLIPFGEKEALFYARIRAETESKGTPIGPNDLIIAATALAEGAILITHNSREFSRVPGLAWEDWTE